MRIKYEPIQLSNIRLAVDLGRQMHGESAYAKDPYDVEGVANAMFHELVESKDGYGMLALDNGRPVGMITGTIDQVFFTHQKRAHDRGWYVVPERRNTVIGMRLLAGFRDWLKDRDVNELYMSVSVGIEPERVDAIFKKLGFEYLGGNWRIDI